jgi:hypothetical protein
MKESKKKQKVVTNDLEDCYQWHEGLDPDHIFDKEREMTMQLRETVSELANESDKFVAVFIFARRHGILPSLPRERRGERERGEGER